MASSECPSKDKSKDNVVETSESEKARFLSSCLFECMYNPFVRDTFADSWSYPDLLCDDLSMELFIYKEMKANNIVVIKTDPDYLKYFCMRVIGFYWCDCNHQWTCYNATIVVDLYESEVSKTYKQYCTDRGCRGGKLCFTNKQFKQVADRVVTYYKKRKEAGGTVPAIENNGSYSSKAFKVHEEYDCQRCHELREPCWLHLVPYVKKVPYEITHLVRSSLSSIKEPLKTLYASAIIDVNDADKVCRIHINPLSGSENIKQWRKQCETLLESFLQNFSSVSLSVQPDVFSKKVLIPKPSLSTELHSVLYITGDKQKVSQAVKRIENITKEIKQQHETGKQKPCIILW